MVHVPSLISSLSVYVPGKPIEAVAHEFGLNPEEIAKLASNENPLGCPSAVQDVLSQNLAKIHIYPDGSGLELRRKIASKFSVSPNQVVLGNGSAELIEMAAKAFLDVGEESMFSQYAFAIYKVATLASNHTFQEIPATPDYGHDLKAFRKAINSKTKVIYIANPNNPTGSMVTAQELDAFVASVPENILIVIDEAYYEFVDHPEYPQSLKYITEQGRKNVLVLRTFSKIYGLAGLRMGYGFAHPDVCTGLEKVRSPFNTNLLGQVGCIRALDCDEHVRDSAALASQERAFMTAGLSALGYKYYGDAGNFLLVDMGRDFSPDFERLQKSGVIVRPLKGYGLPQFFRVSFGTREENQKFLDALKQIS